MALNSCYRKEAIEMAGTYSCTVATHSKSLYTVPAFESYDTTSETLIVSRSRFNDLNVKNYNFEAWSLRNGKSQSTGDSLTSASLRIKNDSIWFSEYQQDAYGNITERRYWGYKN
jgi:hypothetical protein